MAKSASKTAQLINDAVTLHRSGKLDDAATIYRDKSPPTAMR